MSLTEEKKNHKKRFPLRKAQEVDLGCLLGTAQGGGGFVLLGFVIKETKQNQKGLKTKYHTLA